MRTHAENRGPGDGRRPHRPRLTDVESRALVREARAGARRRSPGGPPPAEADFAPRTRHAASGAGAR